MTWKWTLLIRCSLSVTFWLHLSRAEPLSSALRIGERSFWVSKDGSLISATGVLINLGLSAVAFKEHHQVCKYLSPFSRTLSAVILHSVMFTIRRAFWPSVLCESLHILNCTKWNKNVLLHRNLFGESDIAIRSCFVWTEETCWLESSPKLHIYFHTCWQRYVRWFPLQPRLQWSNMTTFSIHQWRTVMRTADWMWFCARQSDDLNVITTWSRYLLHCHWSNFQFKESGQI